MSDQLEDDRTWIERVVGKIIQYGQLPKHMGFIMDGNRRFATSNHLKTEDGYEHGFKKLIQVLKWCYMIGIEVITIYAFSLENFNRPHEQVESLFKLFSEKLDSILEIVTTKKADDRELMSMFKLKFCGDLKRMPEGIREKMAKLESLGLNESESKYPLNVCICYTSKDEIAHSINALKREVTTGKLSLERISYDSVFRNTYLYDMPPPDIIFRTSEAKRLSEFLLFQSQFSLLYFVDVLWPEITIWNLYSCIFHFQIFKKDIDTMKEIARSIRQECEDKNYNRVT